MAEKECGKGDGGRKTMRLKKRKMKMRNGAILRQTERPQTKTHGARAVPPLPRWLPLEASSVGPT